MGPSRNATTTLIHFHSSRPFSHCQPSLFLRTSQPRTYPRLYVYLTAVRTTAKLTIHPPFSASQAPSGTRNIHLALSLFKPSVVASQLHSILQRRVTKICACNFDASVDISPCARTCRLLVIITMVPILPSNSCGKLRTARRPMVKYALYTCMQVPATIVIRTRGYIWKHVMSKCCDQRLAAHLLTCRTNNNNQCRRHRHVYHEKRWLFS